MPRVEYAVTIASFPAALMRELKPSDVASSAATAKGTIGDDHRRSAARAAALDHCRHASLPAETVTRLTSGDARFTLSQSPASRVISRATGRAPGWTAV